MLGNNNQQQSGFTVLELVVVITVFNIVLISLLGIFSGYFANLMRSNIQTGLTIESQQVLSSITEDLRNAAAIRDTNLLPDANQPGGWQTDEANDVLIIALPTLDSSRNFIEDPLTGKPYLDEIIYYQDASDFRKRILANPAATGNRLTTTCPPALATASCPADISYTLSFADLSFEFFDIDDVATADVAAARSVGVDIELLRNSPVGGDINLLNTSRITLRNQES